MNSNQAGPKWWRLYLALPVFAGFAVIDTRLHIATGGHEALQAAALLTAVGWTNRWLRANASALRRMDSDTCLGSMVIHTVSLTGPSNTPVLEDSAGSTVDAAGSHDLNDRSLPALDLPRR